MSCARLPGALPKPTLDPLNSRMKWGIAMDIEHQRKKGRDILKEVIGAAYLERRDASTNDFNRPLRQFSETYAFGDIWARPGLPRKIRSMLCMAMLTAMGKPAELRLHNIVGRGERIRPDLRPMDADLGDDLKRLAKTMDLTEGGRRPLGLVGRGVGVAIANPGELPISTSIVRMHYDGSVTVLCSTVEVGQGLHTVLAQIAAEELGIEHTRITVISPDTRFGPYDWSTGSSRGTTRRWTTAPVATPRSTAARHSEASASQPATMPDPPKSAHGLMIRSRRWARQCSTRSTRSPSTSDSPATSLLVHGSTRSTRLSSSPDSTARHAGSWRRRMWHRSARVWPGPWSRV